MYRNILIPVAFDDDQNTAVGFEAAKALADKDARITLMHVIETVPAYIAANIPANLMTTSRHAVEAKLNALVKEMPSSHAVITDGKPGPRILRWAEENDTDCIIIASHQPAFSDFLLGSVAHHVVRHAKCAVHVVK